MKTKDIKAFGTDAADASLKPLLVTSFSLIMGRRSFAAFSPEIDVFLKEHLFADIFGRDVLGYSDREITNISALISLGGVEPQLRSHMGIGLNVGVSEPQQKQILSVIEPNVGKKEAAAGREVLFGVIASKSN